MPNRKIMREIICLMGTELTRKAGDMVDIQGNYSFFSPNMDLCITITPRPEDRGTISPHIWVKEIYGNDGFYFLFDNEKEGQIRVEQFGHSNTIYEGTTGAEILAQWPENISPQIRPYFVTMLEIYDKASG